jgi:hypothetical protein
MKCEKHRETGVSGILSVKKRTHFFQRVLVCFTFLLLCFSCNHGNYRSNSVSLKTFIEKYPKFIETGIHPEMIWEFGSDGKFKAGSITSTYGFVIEGTWKLSENGQIAISGTSYNTRTKEQKKVSNVIKSITIWDHPQGSEPRVQIEHKTPISVF